MRLAALTLIFETPHFGLVGRGLLSGISVAAAGVILWVLVSGNRIGGPPRRTIEVTAVSVGLGVLAGLGYRIVTAKSDGANIGGGLVLLARRSLHCCLSVISQRDFSECAQRATPASHTASGPRLPSRLASAAERRYERG